MTDHVRPTRGFFLGRILGARVVVQPSTLLTLGLLALLFSSGAGVELNRRTFAIGLLLAVLLFASVFLHELAHAVAARLFKREVREIVITVWGGHTSFDAGGITPVVSGVTAAAGPLANVLLAGAAQALVATGAVADRPATVLQWVALANVILAIFNALPGIPMDGGRVLEAVVWGATGRRHLATQIAAWGGRAVAVAAVAYVVGVPVLQGRNPELFAIIWAAVIFAILWPPASQALKVSRILAKREGLTAGVLMVPAVAVPHAVTVEQARTQAESTQAVEVVVMSPDGTPAGHFPVSLTNAVPAGQRATTSLQSVTMPLPRGTVVSSALHGDDMVDALREWWGRSDVWVVVDDGEVRGVVRLSDALKALQ